MNRRFNVHLGLLDLVDRLLIFHSTVFFYHFTSLCYNNNTIFAKIMYNKLKIRTMERGKMAKTKASTWVTLSLGVIGVVCGVVLINDNQDTRIYRCESKVNTSYYTECAKDAISAHNNSVNIGWGCIIIGAIIGFGAFSTLDK